MRKDAKARVGNRAPRVGEPFDGIASWLALERSTSGFALIRNDDVAIANRQWQAFASGPWMVRAGAGGRFYRDLTTLATQELLRRGGRRRALMLVCERGGGTEVIRLRAERVRATDGEVLVLACDISEEDAHERQLAEMREGLAARDRMAALGRLATGVNHDLGNTVNALALQLQAAERRHGDGPIAPHLRDMRLAVATLHTTIGRLAQLGGAQRRPVGPIELGAAIEAAAELVRYELAARRRRPAIVLSLRLAPELPRVVGDVTDVTHVFVNLLLNARDAMPRGGTIRVAAAARRGEVIVRVEDEGSGIEPARLARIFEPMFTTKGAFGSGLGLSIVQSTMRALGGSVSAGNRPRGGAVFTLRFPVAIRGRRRARRHLADGG